MKEFEMSTLQFVSGKREEIPPKYLSELMKLIQHYREETSKHEPPTIEFIRKDWKTSYLSEYQSIWVLALKKDQVVGYAYCNWKTKYENQNKANLSCYVVPEERRKKIATKMLKELLIVIPEQITKIILNGFDNTTSEAFVKNFGVKPGYSEIISISDLQEHDQLVVEEIAHEQRIKAKEKGYKLIFVKDCEYVFYVNLPKYILMVEEIWNDMPREELDFEDDILTVERYLKMEERNLLLGDTILTFIAIHEETDELVGFTTCYYNKLHPNMVFQGDTGVLKPYRGNGLGLALKYQLLNKILQETEGKKWLTGNAESNEHMRRINIILKHKPTNIYTVYEIPKETFRETIERLVNK
jgi:hypothetical protein